jgi:alpha-L-rhamnosidase
MVVPQALAPGGTEMETRMRINAKWICHPNDGRETPLVPVFRKKFEVGDGLVSAKLHVTAHGIYEAKINGKAVTEDKFTPGLTSYYYRIQVQEYDVTDLLAEGENTWQTTVGDGWWRWRGNYGYRLALLGWLELAYEDGTNVVATDEGFEVGIGPVVKTDLQKGETYDARLAESDWVAAAAETEHAKYVMEETSDAAPAGGGEPIANVNNAEAGAAPIVTRLIRTEGVPVREKERFAGKVLRDGAQNLIVDFGQNIAGYVRMRLFHTKPGQVIHLKHGEALDLEGKFSTANCDGGMEEFQKITYICKGAEVEEYTPHFTFFGFRYVLVEGLDVFAEKVGKLAAFEAVAVYSDMEETGDFTCSNGLINKLVENARWSQKGNFLDVPVDCPTREKNAWTGDAQIYVRTAAYFMYVSDFFKKWLKDQTIEQYESGKVGITFPSTSSVHNPEELARVREKDPHMALAGPTGNGNIGEDSVGWGDSAVWLPYQLYLMYGDRTVLENQYETARRWVEYSLACMREKNPMYADKPWYTHPGIPNQTRYAPADSSSPVRDTNGDGNYIYDTKFHYGEWNEPLPPSPEVVEFFKSGKSASEYVEYMAKFGKPEVATAYTKRSCDNMAHMAEVLGKTEDVKYFQGLSAKIKECYDKYLIAEDGEIQKGHQAAYVRALALDMVSEAKKPLVVAQLKKELEAANYHLNTGFLSTVYLLPTLCDNGLVDEAFRVLEQTDAPGWLHPITLGATTMLENWDGMDTFRDSFNHYSFGAVCQFLFEYVAGIRPDFSHPGFEEFELKPVVGGTLTHAKARYKTKHGVIVSEWKAGSETFHYHCIVPGGTMAHLTLPNGEEHALAGGEYWF